MDETNSYIITHHIMIKYKRSSERLQTMINMFHMRLTPNTYWNHVWVHNVNVM